MMSNLEKMQATLGEETNIFIRRGIQPKSLGVTPDTNYKESCKGTQQQQNASVNSGCTCRGTMLWPREKSALVWVAWKRPHHRYGLRERAPLCQGISACWREFRESNRNKHVVVGIILWGKLKWNKYLDQIQLLGRNMITFFKHFRTVIIKEEDK